MKLDPKLQARLGTLFVAPPGESELNGQLLLVDVERLHTAAQPRTHFDADSLRDLEGSIRELRAAGQGIGGTGLLQPLLVRAQDGGYLVTAGERRLRAARGAGVPQVPVVLSEGGDEDAWEHAIIENLLRADLGPLEEAQAFHKLMKSRGYSVREAAKRLGKDKGYLENRVRLLKMGADVQEMVSLRKDSVAHARVIEGVSDPKLRAELIRATVEDLAPYPAIQARAEKGSKVAPAIHQEVSLRKDTSKNATNDGATDGALTDSKAIKEAQNALKAATLQLRDATRTLPAKAKAREALARALEGNMAQLQALVGELRN